MNTSHVFVTSGVTPREAAAWFTEFESHRPNVMSRLLPTLISQANMADTLGTYRNQSVQEYVRNHLIPIYKTHQIEYIPR